MPFLFFSNINLQFGTKELSKKTYTAAESKPIIRQVKQIDKHRFAEIALDEAFEIFVIYVAALEISSKMKIYAFRAQILQETI